MADFYFFTDFESFIGQENSDKFGPISNTNYRLDTGLDLESGAKAYAVCKGHILIQESQSGGFNIILRPELQPKFDIGEVKYFIYKGISGNSLINGEIVAGRTSNDLTEYAWKNQELTDANAQVTPSNPDIQVLGLRYKSTGIGNLLVENSQSIDSVFFSNDDIQPIQVAEGDHIGNFIGGTTKGRFQILIGKLGLEHTMAIARSNESLFTPTNAQGFTNAESLLKRIEKDFVLAFTDPCSFFGMFEGESNLKVKTISSNSFSSVDIVKKFKNKNRIYLDIRGEFDSSFNLFNDYGDDFGYSLQVSSPPALLPSYDYYSENISNTTTYGTWPMFIIEDSQPIELSPDNEHAKFLIEFPNANSNIKAVYFKEAKTKGKESTHFMFNVSNQKFELSNWVFEEGGLFQFGAANIVLKLVYDSSSAFQSLFPKSTGTVENLFPINLMSNSLPRNPDDVVFQVWQNAAIVEHLEFPEQFGDIYAASLGLAIDKQNYTFFSYPHRDFGHKRSSEMQSFKQFITSKYPDQLDFFRVLFKTSDNIGFELREINMDGYLAQVVQGMTNSSSQFAHQLEERYLNTISLSHEEFLSVQQTIANANFIPSTFILIGLDVGETLIRRLPRYEFRRSELVVHGLIFQAGSSNSVIESSTAYTGIFVQAYIKKH